MTPDPPTGMDGLACPIPIQRYPHVLLAHGGGGRLMHQLIEQIFLEAFCNPVLGQRHDGAQLDRPAGRLAFTTDSYVVRPLFFPGGDIGSLAVNGTVNDLAMCGARPLYLSAGFIIEEGLPMTTLWKLAVSMRMAAQRTDVTIVTGDTKVVDRGKADGVFINTAGIGVIPDGVRVAPDRLEEGDRILLSGDVGRHGIAVMAVREGLEFESPIVSDCAPLSEPVSALLNAGIDLHCLRDLTRGGLTSALVEISEASQRRLRIDETAVPVTEAVRGACEILGFDPLYVANEGRLVAFVPASQAERAIAILRSLPVSESAVVIGEVGERSTPLVTLTSRIGATRVLDMLSGEQLPRIC